MTPPINSVSDDEVIAAQDMFRHSRGLLVPDSPFMRQVLESFLAARRAASTPVGGVAWEQAARTFLSGDDFEALHSLAVAFAEDQAAGVDTSLKPASPALPSQVVKIDEQALEAAKTAFYGGLGKGFSNPPVGALEQAITAYLSCLTSPAAEPVEAVELMVTELLDTSKVADPQMRKRAAFMLMRLYTHPAPSASREVTDSGLAQRLNNAASIIEQWDAWEIGAANKPTVRLTVSASKLLREAAAALTLPERGM